MKQVTLDFSLAGWKDAIREFVLSNGKTFVAAGLVALIAQVDAYQVPTGIQNAAEITIALSLARSVMTSLWVFLTKTSASVVPVEQATQTIEEVPAQG